MVVSLNKIYQTDETRPWWKQKATIVGLTLALSALIILAIVLALYGANIGQALFSHIGAGNVFLDLWEALEWPVAFAAMFVAFSLVYYFAPDLEERYFQETKIIRGCCCCLVRSVRHLLRNLTFRMVFSAITLKAVHFTRIGTPRT